MQVGDSGAAVVGCGNVGVERNNRVTGRVTWDPGPITRRFTPQAHLSRPETRPAVRFPQTASRRNL